MFGQFTATESSLHNIVTGW